MSPLRPRRRPRDWFATGDFRPQGTDDGGRAKELCWRQQFGDFATRWCPSLFRRIGDRRILNPRSHHEEATGRELAVAL